MKIINHSENSISLDSETILALFLIIALYIISFACVYIFTGLIDSFWGLIHEGWMTGLVLAAVSALPSCESYFVTVIPGQPNSFLFYGNFPSKNVEAEPINAIRYIVAEKPTWLLGARLRFHFEDSVVETVRDTWPRWAFWSKFDVNQVGKEFADFAQVEFIPDLP